MRGRSGRIKRKTGTAGLINSYGGDDMQPGDVIYSARQTAPAGYLIAAGAAVSRTVYGNLFDAIGTLYGAGDGTTTFNVPDLRGEFIRGADQGRGVDTGRTVGTGQAGQNMAHSHTGSTALSGDHNHSVQTSKGLAGYSAVLSTDLMVGGSASTGNAGAHTHTLTIDSAGGNEARPRNVALLPLIKY